MTVPNENSRMEYTGNGTTPTFPFTYKIFGENELRVTVKQTSTGFETTLTLNTHYTVLGEGDTDGGSITLINTGSAWLSGGNLASGYTITLRRVVDFTQDVSIANQGPQLPKTHENAFDRSVMRDQQIKDELDRSMKLPETEDPANYNMILPTEAQRANKALGFDNDGNPTSLTLTSVGAPTNASYVCTASQGDLGAERVLTGTANQITVTDNGANSTIVLSIPASAQLSALTVNSLTDSALTAGRVTIAGTSGVLEDDAGLTYDKTTDILTVAKAVKLTPGSAPGALDNGQMWSDSTQLSPVSRTGGMTEYTVRCFYSQTTDVDVQNTTAATSVVTTPAFGTITLPANYLTPGKTLRFQAYGQYANTATPTLTFQMFFGATGLNGCTHTTASGAGGFWRFSGTMTCNTTGASGAISYNSHLSGSANSAGQNPFTTAQSTSTVTVNTTTTNALDLKVQWSAASSSNLLTLHALTIEVMG